MKRLLMLQAVYLIEYENGEKEIIIKDKENPNTWILLDFNIFDLQQKEEKYKSMKATAKEIDALINDFEKKERSPR